MAAILACNAFIRDITLTMLYYSYEHNYVTLAVSYIPKEIIYEVYSQLSHTETGDKDKGLLYSAALRRNCKQSYNTTTRLPKAIILHYLLLCLIYRHQIYS